MAVNELLSDRVRQALAEIPRVTEKKIFQGITFMINDKMCICVSGENLMCRFDPALQDEVAERNGFMPMVMKGKDLKGYCYIHPEGFKRKADFEYWASLCLAFNEKAKSSKKRKK